MFDTWDRFKGFMGRLLAGPPARSQPQRRRPQLEALEERWCPAGTWVWIGAPVGMGGDGLWNNPTGGDWLLNGGATAPNWYPGSGIFGAQDDVSFSVRFPTGPCTLNATVPMAPIQTLEISNWQDVLTLNKDLTVTGVNGYFSLTDPNPSTIVLGAGSNLFLTNLGSPLLGQPTTNLWTRGTITGGANTGVWMAGTALWIRGSPTGLGTNLNVNSGTVSLDGMTGNLPLTAASNYIGVGSSGLLNLDQHITAGRQNLDGGIIMGGHNATDPVVQVFSGGSLYRTDTPVAGVPDQVRVDGAIWNGGTDWISGGAMLNITGADSNGYSYWQNANSASQLAVDAGSNITASAIYKIDIGTVKLQALSGTSMTIDALDGSALTFGNANTTFLTVTDSTAGVPGWVGITGNVTLAAQTTLTENFSGAHNTADVLYDVAGNLNLNGTLNLLSVENIPQKPTAALDFLGDAGGAGAFGGAFSSFSGNVFMATYAGGLDPTNPGYYLVSIT